MARDIQARAIISAVDRTAGPLGRIAGRFRAFGTRMGLDRINRQMANVGRATANVGRELRRTGVIATAAAAAVGGAAIAITRRWANAVDEVAKSARQLGIPTNLLHEMRHVANLTGTSFGAIQSAFDRMVRTSGDGSLVRNIRKINPELATVLEGTRSAEEGFEAIIKVLAETEDVGQRNALAYAAFGRSGAEAMLRVADAGVEGLAKMRAESRELRGTISADAAANAEAFNDSITRIMASIEGLVNAIGDKLAPVLTPLINDLAKWIASNRELIGEKVAEWVERVAEWIKNLSVSVPDLLTRIEGLVDTVRGIADAMGGWETALIGIAVAINARLILAIVNLGKELAKLGAFLLFSPPGLAIAGLLALSAGAAERWDQFSGAVSRALEGISRAAGGLAEAMLGIMTFDPGRAIAGLAELGKGFYEFQSGALSAVYEALRGIVDILDRWLGTDIGGWIDDLGRRFREKIIEPIERFGEWLRNSALGRFLGLADDSAAEAAAAGAKIGKSLADGIRSGQRDVEDAMREVTGSVSDYLPRSPARKGPLRRLMDMGSGIVEQLSRGIERAARRFEPAFADGIGRVIERVSGSIGSAPGRAASAAGRASRTVGGVARGLPRSGTFDTMSRDLIPRLMRDLGLTRKQAAGILGNFGAETGGFRHHQELRPLVPGSRGGAGWAQWTGPRRRAFEAYARQHGLDPRSPEANYSYFLHEIQNRPDLMPDRNVLAKLRRAGSVEEATDIFMRGFEAPGIPHRASRQRWARRALQASQTAPRVPEVAARHAEPDPGLKRAERARQGGGVNITVQSMVLSGESPREHAEAFWREIERQRLSAMTDIGVLD